MTTTASNIIDLIEDIFLRRGSDSYLGEDVTMSQHMLQAALQAENAAADDQLVCAALLHDIGHYTNEFPEDALEQGNDNFHEDAGARILAPWFPQRMVNCVRHHVAAKRYLCAVNADYYDDLSDASKHSLSLQGGVMNAAETTEFASLANLDDIVRVRIWDDLAKNPAQATPDFAHYRPLLEKVIQH